jgi:hypothetical protein
MLAALTYVIQNPRGDEVSLAVLNAVERSEVEALAGRGKRLSRLIRDCENLVVALLAGVMGRASVFVGPAREKSRVAASAYWPSAWADTYRAIRVAVPSPQPERIHFDTVVVRHVISDDRRAIDLSRLAKSKGGHPISLSVPTVLELIAALLDGRIPFEQWKARVGLLDQVLDPAHPIVPGAPSTFAPVSDPSVYRRGWDLLREATSLTDLTDGLEHVDELGRKALLVFDPKTTSALSDFGNRYLDQLSSLLGTSERPSMEDLLASTRFMLEIMGDRPLHGADLALRVSATRALEVIRTGAANPDRKNDGLDGAQLQLVEVGLLCTQDAKLKRRADTSGAFDAWRVMQPDQLMTWLESTPILFGSAG